MGTANLIGAAHDFAAVRVLQPLYRFYQLSRPAWRASAMEFDRGLRFRRGAESWSREQKLEWILTRLRHVAGRAARETPYYRELFAGVGFDPDADFHFAEYARLPVIERADIRDAGAAMLSAAVERDVVRHDATGGSGGTPTEIWTGPEERGWRESGIEYFMRRIGVPAGSRTALLWGHHLDPIHRQGLKDRLHDWTGNRRWFDCLRLSPAVLDRYHLALQRWRPHCVLAYASSLAQLAEEVSRRRYRPTYPTHCCVTGAEGLLLQQRLIVEEVFRRPVYERYGSRDVGLIGFQSGGTPATDFEIDWSNVFVEPESAEGTSSIIVTKLHADAMPMLRYRIGDIGRFPVGAVPGAPTFTLHGVVGREADRIWLPDGKWVHGLELPHLMKDYPVRDFQLVQERDLSVVVKIVPSADFSASHRERILGVLAKNIAGVGLDLVVVDEIERTRSNKRRPVLSAAGARSPDMAI